MRRTVVALISGCLLMIASFPTSTALIGCEEIVEAIQGEADEVDTFLGDFYEDCNPEELLSNDCNHGYVYAKSASGTAWWTWQPWPDSFVTDLVTLDVEWGWADQDNAIRTRCDWIVIDLSVRGEFGHADCEYVGFDNGDQYEGDGNAGGRSFTCGGLGGSLISLIEGEMGQGTINPCTFGGRVYDTQDRPRGTAEIGVGSCSGSGVGFDV